METYIGTMIIRAIPMTRESVEELLNRNIGDEPKGDGYFVQYEDGHQTWRPKDVFDKTYRRLDLLTFGLAIEALKSGFKVARSGWNEKGLWLDLQVSDEDSDMALPCIYLNHSGSARNTPNTRVLWDAPHTDIFAEDWHIVEDGL
jgi:hypothetical protein